MDPYDRYRWSQQTPQWRGWSALALLDLWHDKAMQHIHSWPVKGQVPEWCGDSSTTETCAGLVGQEIAAWPLWRRAFEEVLQPNWQRKAADTASTGTAGEPDTLGHSQIPRWAANHVDILYWRLTNLLSQSRTSPEGRHGILSVPQMTYQHITMPFPASVSGSSGMIWQATVHENIYIYVGIVLSLYMYMWKNEKQIKQDVQLPNIEMTRKLQGENNPPPSEVWRKPLYTFGRSVRFPPTSFSSQEGRFSLRFPESKKMA